MSRFTAKNVQATVTALTTVLRAFARENGLQVRVAQAEFADDLLTLTNVQFRHKADAAPAPKSGKTGTKPAAKGAKEPAATYTKGDALRARYEDGTWYASTFIKERTNDDGVQEFYVKADEDGEKFWTTKVKGA